VNTEQRNERNKKLELLGWQINHEIETLKCGNKFFPYWLLDSNLPVKEFEKFRGLCGSRDYTDGKIFQFMLNVEHTELILCVPKGTKV